MQVSTRQLLIALLAALPVAASVPANAQTPAQAKTGQALFVAKGCYQCHGYSGAGAAGVGARLAPPRLPLNAFRAYVRHPGGVMPRYSATLLPDSEVEAIHAYLKSIPAPRGPQSIPLLAPYVAPQPSPTR